VLPASVLFVHQNFLGQFRHLASRLAAAEHRVRPGHRARIRSEGLTRSVAGSIIGDHVVPEA
jgi:hypothetical protein